MLKVSCLCLSLQALCFKPWAYVFQVDQRLQTKVFLAGLSVTLADLVMFATLYRALVGSKRNPEPVILGMLVPLLICLTVTGQHP